MRILGAIYRSDLQPLQSAAPTVITLILKEIHHGGLMMLAFFFLPVLFKILIACFGAFQYVICGIYGLIIVKIVLTKATDAVRV